MMDEPLTDNTVVIEVNYDENANAALPFCSGKVDRSKYKISIIHDNYEEASASNISEVNGPEVQVYDTYEEAFSSVISEENGVEIQVYDSYEEAFSAISIIVKKKIRCPLCNAEVQLLKRHLRSKKHSLDEAQITALAYKSRRLRSFKPGQKKGTSTRIKKFCPMYECKGNPPLQRLDIHLQKYHNLSLTDELYKAHINVHMQSSYRYDKITEEYTNYLTSIEGGALSKKMARQAALKVKTIMSNSQISDQQKICQPENIEKLKEWAFEYAEKNTPQSAIAYLSVIVKFLDYVEDKFFNGNMDSKQNLNNQIKKWRQAGCEGPIGATMFRKTVTTAVHEGSSENDRQKIAKLQLHNLATAEKYYVETQKHSDAAEASDIIDRHLFKSISIASTPATEAEDSAASGSKSNNTLIKSDPVKQVNDTLIKQKPTKQVNNTLIESEPAKQFNDTLIKSAPAKQEYNVEALDLDPPSDELHSKFEQCDAIKVILSDMSKNKNRGNRKFSVTDVQVFAECFIHFFESNRLPKNSEIIEECMKNIKLEKFKNPSTSTVLGIKSSIQNLMNRKKSYCFMQKHSH